ncbi:FKBP-type peptidyl-prolyl cis-trans isomerase SlyD [hydrothermal vent metagenome]|uniref:peptidylprolyl isomerase n=1 Tax=hydrothermal vent metagenome TaxID=652676 RepID=A0A3B0X576_9ZZZZ
MSGKITANKFVSLIYTITDDDDNTLESIDTPIHYIQGIKSEVIEKIAEALEGHQIGDFIQIPLTPEEGFGIHQPELTFSDDINNVPVEFHVIGAEVEFKNDEGESKIFRVTKIANGKLTVDGNHPYAGKNITYNITVKAVRDATENELKYGADGIKVLH